MLYHLTTGKGNSANEISIDQSTDIELDLYKRSEKMKG